MCESTRALLLSSTSSSSSGVPLHYITFKLSGANKTRFSYGFVSYPKPSAIFRLLRENNQLACEWGDVAKLEASVSGELLTNY